MLLLLAITAVQLILRACYKLCLQAGRKQLQIGGHTLQIGGAHINF